jgi:peroxisomal membrane protein 2
LRDIFQNSPLIPCGPKLLRRVFRFFTPPRAAANLLNHVTNAPGALCFLQEVLGSNFAHVPVKKASKDAPFILHALARAHIDLKGIKMAIYGFLVSAPLSHFLVGALQKAFAGKTGTGARIAQIVASNLLIAPIQTAGE